MLDNKRVEPFFGLRFLKERHRVRDKLPPINKGRNLKCPKALKIRIKDTPVISLSKCAVFALGI